MEKCSRSRVQQTFVILALALLLLNAPLVSQEPGILMGVERERQPRFEPRGPGVLLGPLDPAIKKWYIPSELQVDYRWNPQEYTNYARQLYHRYISTSMEGNNYYDLFGNLIPRSWLVYDWRQIQPTESGSLISEGAAPQRWFSSVELGGDAKGQYSYNITVSGGIRTTLTPLTFSKPSFDGVQIDFMSDRCAATVLASRINYSFADQTPRTYATNLFGGRATVQIWDQIVLGMTLVDARTAITNLDMGKGDPVAGNLTFYQSGVDLTAIAIVLSDDSPEDGEGGAALLGHDVRIVGRNWETGAETVYTLREVVLPGREWPLILGGERYRDFIAADGAEHIVLNYDFLDPAYTGPDPAAIIRVEFDYILANDFRVEMWSDRQRGKQRALSSPPLSSETIDSYQPALLTVRRAAGNIKDMSNLQRVRFDYGLPTANLVGGFTLEGRDVWGIDMYGEWDRNRRYFQYPNAELLNRGKQHEISAQQADAWFFNIGKEAFPWFGFVEVYSLDATYSTSTYIVDGEGDIQYDYPQLYRFEFVDDNDDQDQYPEWTRFGHGTNDGKVFPGWDENNDDISDFNQNDNTIPDYEEPFFRYNVDRPEFLFGIDLNNNHWIDRFEDDHLPDYPYKPDRRGYNAFVGMYLTPEMRLLGGRTDERMPSTAGANTTQYGMFILNRDVPKGTLQIFDMLKRTRDTIPDDRIAPTPYSGAAPQLIVRDLLAAQDTWINTAWIGWDLRDVYGLHIGTQLKGEIYHQNPHRPRSLDGSPLRRNVGLWGVIHKIDYFYAFGPLSLQPRFKNEFLYQIPFLEKEEKRQEWSRMMQVLVKCPVLSHSLFQIGIERYWFNDLRQDEEALRDRGIVGETGDWQSTDLAVQLSTITPNYMGYQVTTQVGLLSEQIRTEGIREAVPGRFEKFHENRYETTSFITVFASMD